MFATTRPPESPRATPSLWLPWLIAGLITYGSLYPFGLAPAAPGAWDALWRLGRLFTSVGDVLGNVGLFVPWGGSAVLALAPRWGWRGAAWLALGLGGLLALAVQVLQIWVPTRDPAMADVLWNGVGTVVGVLLGLVLLQRQGRASGHAHPTVLPALVLLGVVLTQWLPLVPSLDWQLIKDQLKTLSQVPDVGAAAVLAHAALAGLAGYALLQWRRGRASLGWLALGLAVLWGGKLFIRGTTVDASQLLGFALGWLAWWGVSRCAEATRRTAVWTALLASYTVSALVPFELRDVPADMVWLPFSALLEGRMLANVQALVAQWVVLAGILYVGVTHARWAVLASVALGLWALGLEGLQTWLVGRVSDLSEPLLVVVLGPAWAHAAANRWLARGEPVAPTPPAVSQAPASVVPPATLWVRWRAWALACAGLMLALSAALQWPGLPYNVTELFRYSGRWPALLPFSLALLWAGAGAAWLGTRLATGRHGAGWLPLLTLGASTLSYALLWFSVNPESMADLVGSPVVFRDVSQDAAWGGAWQTLFLALNAPLAIGIVEQGVRFVALYAPLPLLLGLLVAAPWRRRSLASSVALLVSALLVVWLCQTVVVDWASTDNLTELIARDGRGWYLYGLLLLCCVSACLLARAPAHGAGASALALLVLIVGVPLGWWLLNQGLEQQVQKYGLVFSAVQFLLAGERANPVAPDALFLRWAALQLGGVGVLTLGLRLGLARSTRVTNVANAIKKGAVTPTPIRARG